MAVSGAPTDEYDDRDSHVTGKASCKYTLGDFLTAHRVREKRKFGPAAESQNYLFTFSVLFAVINLLVLYGM